MDSVRETPVKKRRLDGAGNSQTTQSSPYVIDDSGDEYETVATVPLIPPGNNANVQTQENALIGVPGTSSTGGSRRANGHIDTQTEQRTYNAKLEKGTWQTNGDMCVGSLAPRGDDLLSSSLGLHSYPLPPTMQPPTQPTQMVRNSSPDGGEDVQVFASSPPRVSPPAYSGLTHRPSPDHRARVSPKPNARPVPGRLASAMAPLGTAFRPPTVQRGPARAEPIVINSDDEDEIMPYVGGSSDDELTHTRDIKPTQPTLRRRTSERDTKPDSQQDFSKFVAKYKQQPERNGFAGTILDPARYDGSTSSYFASSNRPDTLAGAYGTSRRHVKTNKQTTPKKASPVKDSIHSLDDIADYQQRVKLQRMHDTLPGFSLDLLYKALLKKRENVDDAVAHVLTLDLDDQSGVDLTSPISERDHLAGSPTVVRGQAKPRAKQTITQPLKSLQEKYKAGSQGKDAEVFSPVKTERRPRKRLVQGRRKKTAEPSSPEVKSSSPAPTPRSVTLDITEISSDSDSGIVTDPKGDLLSFYNTCAAAQLMDLASISEKFAKTILAQAPFRSLKQIRSIDDPDAPSGKRKRAPAGDKVVVVSEQMWAGYQAVDQLVEDCQRISQPVREEMQKWGVDVFGASKTGEIEILSWKADDRQTRDSGIGTPATTILSADEEEPAEMAKAKSRSSQTGLRFFPQPKSLNDGIVLKEYQVVGVNWLDLLFRSRLSGILADDMGLGKTCQVIAFLARLKELGINGPHVVVVPTSTFENWMREFQNFCSSMSVFPYHGSQADRWGEFQYQIRETNPNVIVTTYHLAKNRDDRKFLKSLNPVVCVFDEAHMLKNTQSTQYKQLMNISCEFRLLLTGTPLQNNLRELVSLLGFVLPTIFSEHKDALESIFHHRAKTNSTSNEGGDDTSHAALLSETRIAKAKAMLAPFVLRRKKEQVLHTLPPKTQQIRYCEMTATQAELYESELARLKAAMAQPKGARKEQVNVLMVLRKAAIHPWLFRRGYTDATLTKMARAFFKRYPDREEELVLEDLQLRTDAQLDLLVTEDEYAAPVLRNFRLQGEGWMDSGKVTALLELLSGYAANGDRALVFSQFTQVLDILERVFQEHGIKFTRLDGSTPVIERQPLLDMFTNSPDIPVFLLSTKAGGAGINLVAANRVIIFDSSFNPQDDVQAENRAHRVGQTRPVEVVRLVTRGTIEEQILELGKTKLALGDRVAGEDGEANRIEASEEPDGEKASSHNDGTSTKRNKRGNQPQKEEQDSTPQPNAKQGEAQERDGQQRVLHLLRAGLGK